MSQVFGPVGGGIVRLWSQETRNALVGKKMTESRDGREQFPQPIR